MAVNLHEVMRLDVSQDDCCSFSDYSSSSKVLVYSIQLRLSTEVRVTLGHGASLGRAVMPLLTLLELPCVLMSFCLLKVHTSHALSMAG